MTRDYRSGPESPGDIGDPVADEIRRQQNMDAAPSPEEAARAKEKWLADQGCTECDESDPAKLNEEMALLPSCSAAQAPPDPRVVYCDDCLEERETLRERSLRRARERDENDRLPDVHAVVLYECENAEFATHTERGGQHPPGPPSVPIRCRCGSEVSEVVYLDD